LADGIEQTRGRDAQGQTDGSLARRLTPGEASQMILSGLEGAMLLARTYGDITRFQSSAERLLEALAP
jgi:hypothetical protein